MAGDLGYVVVFPQFFGATYCDSWVNSAGSVASIMVRKVKLKFKLKGAGLFAAYYKRFLNHGR